MHLRLVPAITLAFVSASSSLAATTTYDTSASFLAALSPGYYTETFDNIAQPDSPAAFSGGSFAYSVSSPGDLYASGEFLGTSLPDAALTISFTSGNVTAVGGNFYVVNLSDAFKPVSVSLALSDGTSLSFAPTSVADSFRGFVSTVAITSLVIGAPGVSLYASVDNLTAGAAPVPEPATWLLWGLGAGGLLAARRRRAG
jgi:hypothetical protein